MIAPRPDIERRARPEPLSPEHETRENRRRAAIACAPSQGWLELDPQVLKATGAHAPRPLMKGAPPKRALGA